MVKLSPEQQRRENLRLPMTSLGVTILWLGIAKVVQVLSPIESFLEAVWVVFLGMAGVALFTLVVLAVGFLLLWTYRTLLVNYSVGDFVICDDREVARIVAIDASNSEGELVVETEPNSLSSRYRIKYMAARKIRVGREYQEETAQWAIANITKD